MWGRAEVPAAALRIEAGVALVGGSQARPVRVSSLWKGRRVVAAVRCLLSSGGEDEFGHSVEQQIPPHFLLRKGMGKGFGWAFGGGRLLSFFSKVKLLQQLPHQRHPSAGRVMPCDGLTVKAGHFLLLFSHSCPETPVYHLQDFVPLSLVGARPVPILELIAVTWPCEYDLLLERYAKAVALSVVTVEGLFLPPFIQGSQMRECYATPTATPTDSS